MTDEEPSTVADPNYDGGMPEGDFKFMVEQLRQIQQETIIGAALVNPNVHKMLEAIPHAESPIGIGGMQVVKYNKLRDEHVLFFSSVTDALEFIDACEECITNSPEADPDALVGVIIECSKQRLIKRNSIIDQELKNVKPDA